MFLCKFLFHKIYWLGVISCFALGIENLNSDRNKKDFMRWFTLPSFCSVFSLQKKIHEKKSVLAQTRDISPSKKFSLWQHRIFSHIINFIETSNVITYFHFFSKTNILSWNKVEDVKASYFRVNIWNMLLNSIQNNELRGKYLVSSESFQLDFYCSESVVLEDYRISIGLYWMGKTSKTLDI